MLQPRLGDLRCEKRAKVSASMEQILDTSKCSAENKDGVVIASGHRVGGGHHNQWPNKTLCGGYL